MKATSGVPLIVVVPILLLTACSYIDGQCWPASEDGHGGAAGAPIVPTGAGGFGDVPPKPQDASGPPPPDCNMAPQTACTQKCLSDYEAAAASCGKIENEAQRKSCQDSAYASYKTCKDSCQKIDDCLEQCKEDCDRDWEQCRDDCPRGDKNCLAECTNTLASCYKKCKERCK